MKSAFERDTLYTILVKIPTTICVLIYMILLTRLLGPEGNGVYTLIITNIQIASLLLSFGSKSSTTFFSAKKKLPIDKILGLTILFLGIAISLMSLLLLLTHLNIAHLRSVFLPSRYTETFFFVFILFMFLFKNLFRVYHSLFTGLTHFKELNAYHLISHLVQVVVIGGLYFYCQYSEFQCSMSVVFLWILLIEFLNSGIFTFLFFKKIPFRVNYQISIQEDLIPFLKYGIKGYGYNLGEYINKRLDVWLIEIYKGTAVLGQYGLATQVSNFVLELIRPINVVLFPYLTKMEKEKGAVLFCKIFRVYVIFYLFFAASVWLTADKVIPFVFGVAFLDSIFPMKLLVIAVVFAGTRNILSIYNKAYERQRFSLIGTYLGLIATIILGFWWVPLYGIIGAAYVSLVAYGMTALFMFVTLLPHLKQPLYLLFIPQKSDWIWLKMNIQQLMKKNI